MPAWSSRPASRSPASTLPICNSPGRRPPPRRPRPRANSTTASAERQRYADLLARRFVSQAAFDARENAFRNARARLEQARAQGRISANQVGYGTLTTDHAGVVATVLADAGQVVTAGQPVFRLARHDEKEVALAIPEGRLAEVTEGFAHHRRPVGPAGTAPQGRTARTGCRRRPGDPHLCGPDPHRRTHRRRSSSA